MDTIKPEEIALFDDISKLSNSLIVKTRGITGLKKSDPAFFSVLLFKRLWSHHRSYALLWNNDFGLEGDMVLRAGLESAICIAANVRLREKFVLLMRQDAAFTIQGQIKVRRSGGDNGGVSEGEETLRNIQATLPEGTKAAKLNWQTLAEQGNVPQLYDFHRMLSGVSAHVTGLSLLRGDGFEDNELQAELHMLTRRMHLMMMGTATLQGSMFHIAMLDDAALAQEAEGISDRLGALSFDWPGVA